jgi:hypothetical protein
MKSAAEILGYRGPKTYRDQLLTDSWKRFASGLIRERGNACENCRQTGKPLQVHHIAHTAPTAEQEPKEHLIVLCRPCHMELHAELIKFRNHVFRHLNGGQFAILNGALAVGLTKHNPLEFVHAIAELASSPDSVKRFAYAWNGGKQP